MNNPALELLAAATCITLGAFIAGVDAAASGVPEARLRALAEELGGARGARIQRFLVDPQAVYTRMLAVRVAALVAASVLASNALLPARAPAWHAALVVFGLTLVYGVVAEVSITVGRARALALVAWGLAASRAVEWLALPVALPLLALGRVIRASAARSRASDPPPVTERAMEYLVDEVKMTGALDARRAQMLHRVLELKDRAARDVMVPRTKVVALDERTSITDAVTQALAEGHSRWPVYAGQRDNVVAVLHVKDLFRAAHELSADEAKRTTVASVARRTVLCVPPAHGLLPLLREMQSKQLHLAVVVDEFGALVGVVSMEDVLEELVGEIRDEHDADEEPALREEGDGRYTALGDIALSELGEALGVRFPEELEYSTLGGFLAAQLGRVPAVGERVEHEHVEFVVLEGDNRHVAKVSVRRERASGEGTRGEHDGEAAASGAR